MSENPLQNMLNLLSPLFGSTPERFERFVCWAQYLRLADMNLQRYMAWEKSESQSDDLDAMWEPIALQSVFYASMYVVVEGWREAQLSDPSVDELLNANPEYQDLLRRYRNSVFHYQSSFDEIHKKRLGFLAEQETAGPWVCLLHQEFCRFYWKFVPRAEPHLTSSTQNDKSAQRAAELASEIRRCMVRLIGWVPTEILPAMAQRLREIRNSAIARLREAADFESDEALQLLKLVRESTEGITQFEFENQRLKHELIEQLKALRTDRSNEL